jgi:hypothetical protein
MDNKLDNVEELKNLSENEIDPRLHFDAFMGGVPDGGLRSVASINLIVCYIIANINGKVTAQNIIDTIDEGMIANHFEISDAISRLKKSSIITQDEDGALHLSDEHSKTIDLIEKDLPLTIREKSIRLCQKIIAKETFKRENKAEIIENENGEGFNVVLRVSDKDNDFMTLNLWTATRTQAEIIKDKFITNPIRVYDTLIESIFSNDD